MTNNTYRILAENVTINNNTRETGINNNDLIIGPSGSGKTMGYVIPNILNSEESLIITDTKGVLHHQLGEIMQQRGYKVISIDFKDLSANTWGYNPMDLIRRDPKTHTWNEQDIVTIAKCICPIRVDRDPFWEQSAQMYLECLLSYVVNNLPPKERNFTSVNKLAGYIGTDVLDNMMEELESIHPDSFTVARYRKMRSNRLADRTEACIKGFLYNALNQYDGTSYNNLFNKRRKINFRQISREKTVVFLNVSDTDRSRDDLVNLFYTQALQSLCLEADSRVPEFRLKVPVRFILDDFATNTLIPDFDNILSVIRSRDISASLIIQSISQLQGLYGYSKATTIINNCDNILYLGGQDSDTAKIMSEKLNKTVFSILTMPLDKAYLFTRGGKPKEVNKIKVGGETYCRIDSYLKALPKTTKHRKVNKSYEK